MFAPVRNARRAAVALTLLSTACLALTACQGSGTGTAAGTPSAAQSQSPTAQATGSGAPAPDSSATSSAGTTTVPVDLVRCLPQNLTAAPARRVEPTNPDDTYAVDVQLTNSGPHACLLKGFPTVGIAGSGAPGHSKPLEVTETGAAHNLRLAPGRSAWLRLTFRQVLGEANGYCASGATPAAPPSIVVGVPSGGIQIGFSDGSNFAECDDVVHATSFLAARP